MCKINMQKNYKTLLHIKVYYVPRLEDMIL